MADNHWNGANGHGMGGGARHRSERFQSPRGRFPDDRGFDGGRAGHQGGHGTWNSPRAPIQHPRQNFHERDGHRDWQNGSVGVILDHHFNRFSAPTGGAMLTLKETLITDEIESGTNREARVEVCAVLLASVACLEKTV